MQTVEISEREIEIEKKIENMKDEKTGAFVIFVGAVRGEHGLKKLEIESSPEMAEEEIKKIHEEALSKFPIRSVDTLHRVGSLRPQEDIISIIVGSEHRDAAFDACKYIIDEIKKRVPIWKKEIFENHERWVSREE